MQVLLSFVLIELYFCHSVITLNNQETAMDLVKRVLGDYSREVVLLLSGTNTAFQVRSTIDY